MAGQLSDSLSFGSSPIEVKQIISPVNGDSGGDAPFTNWQGAIAIAAAASVSSSMTRHHSVSVPSQWEMALHCNAISHTQTDPCITITITTVCIMEGLEPNNGFVIHCNAWFAESTCIVTSWLVSSNQNVIVVIMSVFQGRLAIFMEENWM